MLMVFELLPETTFTLQLPRRISARGPLATVLTENAFLTCGNATDHPLYTSSSVL